jgi:16S rRNA processing protein RimM
MPRLPAKAGHSGSPSKGEPVYLTIGLLRRPHGVHGEILMEVVTDFPERIKPGLTVFVGTKHSPVTISSVRDHNDGLLLGFEGLETPESVGRYRSQTVYIHTTDSPKLPKGQYYFHQIVGLKVVDDAGQELGRLTDILETGANDVYVVTSSNGQEHLLPAIKDVILDVNLKEKLMTVHVITGLFDQEE